MELRNCRFLLVVGLLLEKTFCANGISECPAIKIEPSTVVVRFGDPVSVNCTVSGDHDGIGWEASQGSVAMVTGVKFVTWRVESLTDWDISPKCFANFDNVGGPPLQCNERLNITVYQPPSSVDVRAVRHTGPMLEGEQYQLQCEVQNIAPVDQLVLKLYKGETVVHQAFYYRQIKTPRTESLTHKITPTSADDGAQYSCVAELNLGPEGPQPPPSYKSDTFNITVHYPPVLELVQKSGKVTEGDEVILECLAEGNPTPVLTWNTTAAENPQVSTRGLQSNATISRATSANTGIYTCNARNRLGTASKNVTVTVSSASHVIHNYMLLALFAILMLSEYSN